MAMENLDALGAADADRWAYNRLLNRPQGQSPSYGQPPQGAAQNTGVWNPPTGPTGQPPAVPTYTSAASPDREDNQPPAPPQAPPGYGFGRNADGSENRNPNGTPIFAPSTAAGPTPTTRGRQHTYVGSALDFYGTGDIDGVDHIKRGNVGETGGFTEDGLNGNLGVRGSNTIKNVNGRFFSNLPAKPSSIPILLADPEFRALFPNAKQVGFDKIDYGDGKPVDVLEFANPNDDTAKRWQWGVEDSRVPATAGKGYTDWKSKNPITAPVTTPPGTTPPGDTGSGINEDAYRLLSRSTPDGRSLADLV